MLPIPVSAQEYSLLMLTSIRKRRFHKRNTLHRIKTPGDMLIVVTQGKGILCVDNQALPLRPNQTYYLMQGKAIEVIIESDNIEFYVMLMKQVAFSKQNGGYHCTVAASERSLFPIGKLPIKQTKQHVESVEQFYEESRSTSLKDPRLQLKFQSLIHAIPQELPALMDNEDASKGIDQSITYMYKHFSHKIKLETLSDIAGLTPTSYSRSFKKAKSMSPVEYLNHIRIDSSKESLQQHEPSIKEIASAVGFGNEFYFSRMFKSHVGISPMMYVKRRQLKVAVASCFQYLQCLQSLGVEDAFELNGFRQLELGVEENQRRIQVQLANMRNYQPELIIADYRHMPLLDQLKQIAPTVIIDFSMDWRKYYMRIAELVGREKEAQQCLTQLALRVNYAKDFLTNTIGNSSISLVRLYNQKIRVQGMIDHPLSNLLYVELGLKPGSCVPLNERTKEFSLESMLLFETDYLLIDKRLAEYEDTAWNAGVLNGTSWEAMQAGKSTRTRVISNWIRMSWAPTGQHQIIDELLNLG